LLAVPTLRDWAALFETGSQLEALEADFAARASTMAACIGTRFRGWETAIIEVKAAIDWTATLNSLTATPIPQLICEMVMGARTYPDLAGQRHRHAGALTAFDASWHSAASYLRVERLPWPNWDEALVSIASQWCDELIADSGAANDWLDYCVAVRRLDTALVIGCTAAVRNATEHSAHVPGIVLRHVFLVWLDGVYATSRSLQIAPRDLAAVTQEFRELDRKLPVSARDRVRSQCTGALSGLSANQSFGEMGVLNHQLTLRRKQLPVRKLVERIPNLLPTIKPCFMMSPLAVSQYLPRGNGDGDTLSFDAVIFDEASQVFPEDAVPSIARARQCVVVGDQQQLPPTSFFRSEEEECDDEDEPEESGNRLENVESILDALVGMRGAGVSDVYLQVHYRSQHDNLIRYSNHYFYEDRLLTFPSAHGSQPGHGVRSVYLPEGRFEAGGSRTNRKEAERVVELAYELMASQPANESIGVVALSRAQADLIQQLFDQRRLDDRRFDERFAEEARERFFVKNLENVQGDERDHILLSIGYGPTTGSGVVPNRFGPLNAEGGHRRLNVAVSRARKSMTVVHSLRAEDIHSETKGALLLRRYLEYARNGEAAIEGEVSATTGGEAESPFEEAVGRALEERGLRISRQVGCAKYRIDLAVRSDDGDGYDLAVECDGATYHRSPSARDRDRIRQEVLERLGWMGRIHRVWSTAWIRNPKAECDAIMKALESARARPRAERSAERAESTSRGGVPTPGVPGAAEALRATPKATVTESSTLFPPYELASLRHFRSRGDLRDESPHIIADLASWVVQCEEPVHIDFVVERVRRHYDLQRAGIHVRTAVESGIELAIRFRRVERLPRLDGKRGVTEFLGSPGKGAPRPRSADASGVVRPIDRVSDQELAAGVLQVVRGLIGAPRDDVVVATARAFGYARTGGIVDSRLGLVIGELLRSGALVERLGSLVAAVSDQA
jgi:very-short-patch-repair endonuclease